MCRQYRDRVALPEPDCRLREFDMKPAPSKNDRQHLVHTQMECERAVGQHYHLAESLRRPHHREIWNGGHVCHKDTLTEMKLESAISTIYKIEDVSFPRTRR